MAEVDGSPEKIGASIVGVLTERSQIPWGKVPPIIIEVVNR
jgi:hypothetical protein